MRLHARNNQCFRPASPGRFRAGRHAGPAAAQAPSGEAVYKQNCAACHEGNLPRMPTRAALRELTPEHVETALSSFSMRRQGASLSSAERRAVAEFVTGRPSGRTGRRSTSFPRAPTAPPARPAARRWPARAGTGGASTRATRRFQPAAAAGLTRGRRAEAEAEVGLRRARRVGVGLAGVGGRVAGVRRQPQRHRLLARREDGMSGVGVRGLGGRALDAARGRAAPPATPCTSATPTRRSTRWTPRTGALKWKTKAEDHLDAIITGGVSYANGRVFVPVASMEEASGAHPDVSVLHVPRQRAGARRGVGQADLEDLHHSRRAAADHAQQPRHAALRSVRRRRVGRARARCRAQPRLHRHRRRLFAARRAVHRRDHGARDGHREDRLGAPDAGGRCLERSRASGRTRPARRTVRPRRAPTTTSAPPPRSSRSTTGAVW